VFQIQNNLYIYVLPMKTPNILTAWLLSASILLHTSSAQAQEKVQGLVCTIVETCDLDKSSLSTSYRAFSDNVFTDIEERVNVNLQCVWNNGMRSTGTQVLTGWLIAPYNGESLVHYKLRHPKEEDSISQKLWYNQDMNCYFWDIEVPKGE